MILSVDYIDGKQDTYKGLVFDTGKEKIRFDTCDPIIDYIDFMKYFTEKYPNQSFMNSSSVDHFFFDGDKYHDKYFNDDGTISLKKEGTLFDDIKGQPHLWVTDNLKTMNELKTYYRKFKKEHSNV